ncbi:MAG: hypothetical protein HQL01_14460 [Nitrospirae bacterium]|nr:hypothetical protein [Nitrospirota bacterium]
MADLLKQYIICYKVGNLISLLQVVIGVGLAYLALKHDRYHEEVNQICGKAKIKISSLAKKDKDIVELCDKILTKLESIQTEGFFHFVYKHRYSLTGDNWIVAFLTISAIIVLVIFTVNPSHTSSSWFLFGIYLSGITMIIPLILVIFGRAYNYYIVNYIYKEIKIIANVMKLPSGLLLRGFKKYLQKYSFKVNYGQTLQAKKEYHVSEDARRIASLSYDFAVTHMKTPTDVSKAIWNLKKAIEHDEKYKGLAKTNDAFRSLRSNSLFKEIIK